MYIVFLRFAEQRHLAGPLMEAHNAWVQRGLDQGVFLLVGSLKPGLGGAVLAHGCSRDQLERRLAEDPFVAEGVVRAELHEVAPARAEARLAFLVAQARLG
jgi:uncharacterized protein YciI